MNFNNFVSDISKILDIETPTIEYYDCIYAHNNKLYLQSEFNKKELPPGGNFMGGYYDGEGKIYISKKRPDRTKDGESVLLDKSEIDCLYSLAHELRHVWQCKYHEEKYYKESSYGEEAIDDPAEIDADAFAYAYIFSSKTSFDEEKKLKFFKNNPVFKTDGNKRISQAKTLLKEYGL